MPAKSMRDHYGSIAITIHWLSALLIMVLLVSGFRAANTVDPTAKAQVLSVHAPLAILILLLTLARIVWWWFTDNKPDPIAGMSKWQGFSARAVHVLFYVVILGMTASGIGMFVLSGAADIVFGATDAQLPDFTKYKPRAPHGIGARAM
ncbi:MAG: cytochrome b, partial [Gammaproteobacteria bacterium]|nr:cytochrome b [Gammaproteobacteria bacterium]